MWRYAQQCIFDAVVWATEQIYASEGEKWLSALVLCKRFIKNLHIEPQIYVTYCMVNEVFNQGETLFLN